MCCTEEGLNWGAEESLVHVFDPVLNVCDCVDVVGLMRHTSGGCDNVGCGWFWTGCDGCDG